MTTSSIIIIALLAVIIVLLIVVFCNKKSKVSNGSNTDLVVNSASPKSVELAEVSELVLQNALGQELTFTRPNELQNRNYVEITPINRAGNVMQNIGEAALPEIQKTQTLNKLKEMSPNGLFTSQIPKSDLSKYKLDGTFSSVQYSKGGVKSHKGFVEVDSSQLKNISPVSVANMTMQGMAAISGQYYMKQITDSLMRLEKNVDMLRLENKYEKAGTLISDRKTLQGITQKSYCDAADLLQIRGISDRAGAILGQYELSYNDFYNELMAYNFKGGIAKTALEGYNNRITELRDVMSICMIADRIVAEAKLAEMVARGKISCSDPAIYELSKELERHSIEGFNGSIKNDIHGTFSPILEKANAISEKSIEGNLFGDEEHRKKRLDSIKDNVRGLKNDIVDMTDSVYGRKEDEENQELLLMLDDVTGETRVFIPEEE